MSASQYLFGLYKDQHKTFSLDNIKDLKEEKESKRDDWPSQESWKKFMNEYFLPMPQLTEKIQEQYANFLGDLKDQHVYDSFYGSIYKNNLLGFEHKMLFKLMEQKENTVLFNSFVEKLYLMLTNSTYEWDLSFEKMGDFKSEKDYEHLVKILIDNQNSHKLASITALFLAYKTQNLPGLLYCLKNLNKNHEVEKSAVDKFMKNLNLSEENENTLQIYLSKQSSVNKTIADELNKSDCDTKFLEEFLPETCYKKNKWIQNENIDFWCMAEFDDIKSSGFLNEEQKVQFGSFRLLKESKRVGSKLILDNNNDEYYFLLKWKSQQREDMYYLSIVCLQKSAENSTKYTTNWQRLIKSSDNKLENPLSNFSGQFESLLAGLSSDHSCINLVSKGQVNASSEKFSFGFIKLNGEKLIIRPVNVSVLDNTTLIQKSISTDDQKDLEKSAEKIEKQKSVQFESPIRTPVKPRPGGVRKREQNRSQTENFTEKIKEDQDSDTKEVQQVERTIRTPVKPRPGGVRKREQNRSQTENFTEKMKENQDSDIKEVQKEANTYSIIDYNFNTQQVTLSSSQDNKNYVAVVEPEMKCLFYFIREFFEMDHIEFKNQTNEFEDLENLIGFEPLDNDQSETPEKIKVIQVFLKLFEILITNEFKLFTLPKIDNNFRQGLLINLSHEFQESLIDFVRDITQKDTENVLDFISFYHFSMVLCMNQRLLDYFKDIKPIVKRSFYKKVIEWTEELLNSTNGYKKLCKINGIPYIGIYLTKKMIDQVCYGAFISDELNCLHYKSDKMVF